MVNATSKRVVAGLLFFVVCLGVFVTIGMVMTSEGAAAWKAVIGGREPDAATKLPLSAFREWRDLREEPPERIAALDGTTVRVVGLCRPAPELGGMWLVGERRAVTAAEVPLNWSVWIALPADAIDEITARRGSPARVAGVLRVGLAEIGAGKSAAFTLEPAGLWMPRPEAEALGADYGADNDAEHDAEQRQ